MIALQHPLSAPLVVVPLLAATLARAQEHPAPAPDKARVEASEFAPMVEIQSEDYAEVRRTFHTKLLREVPSPQPFEPVAVPAGVRELKYTSGKLQLGAWISDSKGDGKRAAVLFLHGGFAFGIEDWDASKPFRDAGYVVMTPLLRAENGQPGAFSFFYDEVDDALAAAECLAQQPHVDAERLFLAGPSAGGTVALLAAMATKRFRAAASFSATPDQVLFCKHAKHVARDAPVDIANPRELQVRSPLAYAASFKCPARIFHGSLEPEWKQTSQLMAEVAKKHSLDVEAVEVPGDHESSVLPGVQRAIAFFRDHDK